MQIQNTRQAYGLIAILLHWIIALGFLASYVSVYYREWFTEAKTPERLTALEIHISIGITIAAFVVLRIIWRAMNVTPEDLPGSRLEHLAAHAMHLALYAMMILVPITGYLGTDLSPKLLFLFDVPKFGDTAIFQTVVDGWMGMSFKEFKGPFRFIHQKSGATIVWWLIALHAGAAIYQHVVRKNLMLRRMLSPFTEF